MAKFKFKSLGFSCVLAAGAMLCAAPTAEAGIYLNEDFSTYDSGGLYNQNGWMHHSVQTIFNDPIMVVDQTLGYPGFASISKAATISYGTETNQEKLKKQFRDKTDSTEPLYFAALVNLSQVPTNTKATYFLSFITANANADAGLEDQKGGNEYGRVFAYQSPNDPTKVRFGISKYSATMGAKLEDREFDLGETVLIICKWEYVDGTTNDVIKCWINPVQSEEEPAADLQHNSGADPTLGAAKLPIQGIEIRQGRTSSKETPGGFVGPIRVATSWAELWDGCEDPDPNPSLTPKIIAGSSAVTFPPAYQGGAPLVQSLVVKGENLTEDITVGGLSTILPSVSTIPMAEAMSTAGYSLSLSLPLDAAGAISETMTLSSEGASPVNVSISGDITEVISKSSLSELSNLDEEDYNIYRYTGEAVVTFVDATQDIVYAQDAAGGVKINTGYYFGDQTLKRGDKITDIICVGDPTTYGGGAIMPADEMIATVLSEGNEVEPISVTLAQLSADRQGYMSRVVKVSDLTFTNYSPGTTIGTSQTPVSSGNATGAVRAFPGSAAVGLPMPEHAMSVTGIATSKTASVISMRDADAIEVGGVAELSIEAVKEYDDDYAAINTSTVHTKYTVTASNLQSPVQIWLGGAGRTSFSIDTEEIPAGSSTTVVTVSYVPTAVGKHTAMINFDASPAVLSQSFSLSAKAWDPANPPTVTVDDESLVHFEANVGETSEQTLTYTSANLLDWGTVRVASESGSAFRINTTTLLKNGQGQIKVTFAPTSEGTFSEQIVFSADKMEPISVAVSGTTSGGSEPEQKQGDELVYDAASPRALVVEDFENCGGHNRPLSIDGWKNVAVDGTRAWWAYTFPEDGNTAAKVTPYDSQMAGQESCEMLLLSPALDFVNPQNRLLAFSVMGQYMTGDAADEFEVCYIDLFDEEPYILPIEGLDIPNVADMNGEWIPYVVNLDGLDLADIFFIGFRFKSLRGADHSATYYVDNFSWGSPDVPYIQPSVYTHEFEAEVGTSYESEAIAVSAQALGSVIEMSVSGADAECFSVSPSTLPSNGGNLKVSFLGSEIREYEAILKLSAAGAPDAYILLKANATEPVGINGVEGELSEMEDVYTMQGIRIVTGISRCEALRTLPAGIYLFGNKKLVVK